MARAASAQRVASVKTRTKEKASRAGTTAPDVRDARDDVRRRVLDAAVELIERVGLDGLSMREVARAAGVSHQAPYHYFADREAILAALAQEGFVLLGDLLDPVVKAEEPAVDRFVRAGQSYVEFALAHPALFRIMFRPDMVTMEHFPETHACGERCFAIVPELVAECIAEGLPPYPSPEALVVMAWSLPHGLACLLLDGPLLKTLPEHASAEATAALTRDVMTAMRALLVSRSAAAAQPAAAPRAVRSAARKTRR